MFRNISIGTRILLITVLLLVIIIALTAAMYFTTLNVQRMDLKESENIMLDGKKEMIKLGTETMATALGKALTGVTDRQQQHDIIKSYIQDYRFEDDKSGYYFTYIGTVIFMHPTLPQREGEDLGKTADANGVYYVSELYANAQKGGGFVSFIFPKPPAMENAPKIAYVMYIPGTDIWISTGIYIDNINTTISSIEDNAHEMLNVRLRIIISILVACILFILGPLCVFILRSITKPLKNTVKAAQELAGGNLDVTLTVTGRDEITALEKSFMEMSRKLRDNFADIQSKETQARMQAEEAQHITQKLYNVAMQVEQAAIEVEETVSGVSHSTDEVKSGGDAQVSRIAEIHRAMETLSSGVLQITNGANTAANQAQDSHNKVEAGVNMSEQSGKAMEELYGITGNLTENVNRLGEQSKKIGSIMNVI
ncbi:MAG: methyl-accepting chemotaxis protein, partial [Treponema sp.]|nr:methyl-accepting chemotaxis protein [Treponema sp.]